MSYDLFMKPRLGTVTREEFLRYFASRAHYEDVGDQAWYRNKDTGVYFVFERSDTTPSNAPDSGESEGDLPLSFNINYFRPSFFGKEAEPEVQAFIRQFDLLVSDPQIGGMGTGEYNSAKFLIGWANGNEFGYRAILQQDSEQALFTAPELELEQIWRWNFKRLEVQAMVGESHFVPRIFFLNIDGDAKSAVVWPDAIPSLLPKVAYLVVGRRELAPKRLFRQASDTARIAWWQAERVIRDHSSTTGGGFLLNYSAPPRDVVELVRSHLPRKEPLQGIAADAVLDAELVAKHRTAPN